MQTIITVYVFDHIENTYSQNGVMWGQYWYYTGTRTTITQVQIKDENLGVFYDSHDPDDRTETTEAITGTRTIIRRWVEE